VKKIIKWFKSDTSIGFVIFLLGVSILSSVLIGKHYVKVGSILKSRQIGEAADLCYEKGGVLFIDNLEGGLEFVCQDLQVEIEVLGGCSKQDELIKHLIRKDYKRLYEGIGLFK